MTEFEALSILVACLALIVSLVTFSGQRRLQREANDLQRVTADLSKKQLALIEQQEKEKNSAHLSLSLVREGRGYSLVLRNIGQVVASAVELESLGQGVEDVLVATDEVEAKFPLARFRPTEEVRLSAGVYLGSPAVFQVRLRWRNPVGDACEEEYKVGV